MTKVGSAISMIYISGQSIVFVGTGQTYTDMKIINFMISRRHYINCSDALVFRLW